jgi:hypothetical protein
MFILMFRTMLGHDELCLLYTIINPSAVYSHGRVAISLLGFLFSVCLNNYATSLNVAGSIFDEVN